MTRECYFCGRPLRPVLIAGRTVMPGYCVRCGQEKDQELGEGWEQQEWAKFLFADVAREARDDERETQYVRLEDIAAAIPEPRITTADQCQVDQHRQAIYELFVMANLGARRIKRLMDAAGEDRSMWQVQEALRVAKAEGLRETNGE